MGVGQKAVRSINKAIRQIVREYYFFQELEKDLKDLKQAIKEGKRKQEVKDIKLAFKDFKYIGRAERRFNNYEKLVEEFFKLLGQKVISEKETSDLISRI